MVADGTVQDEVKQKHHRDETEFWVVRPLDEQFLDYASFDIAQLRALHKVFRPTLSAYPHISIESKRYVELYKDQRRPVNQWHVEHGVLPQEIIEHSTQIKS